MEIPRPDKVLFPEDGVTKRELADYYRRVATAMLPYVRERPVSMHRYPDGIEGKDFYQKEAPDYFPSSVAAVDVARRDGQGSIRHVLANDADTLVYLAGQACITPHVWLSRRDRLDHPDRLVVDFDPPGDGSGDAFRGLVEASRAARSLLEGLGLEAFVMTTGSSGLHVWSPLDRSAGFDEVRAFALDAAALLARRLPDQLTVEQRKEARGDRIFLDVLRNAYGQTSVPPYAVRARPGAPVAMPLGWDELGRAGMGPRRYTVRNAFRRLAQKGDAWDGLIRRGRSLRRPRELLDRLTA